MEHKTIIDLRKEWEDLSAEQLGQLLREEAGKPAPDDDKVIALLHLVEEREERDPQQMTPAEEVAWKRYKAKAKKRSGGNAPVRHTLARVASLVLILGVLFFALPQTAQADSFWDRLVRLTDEILDFFGPRDNEHRLMEYEFKTDNPGLQELYDTVVELGITEPVVPMWLPENGDMLECKILQTPVKTSVAAHFPYQENGIIINISINAEDLSQKTQKDDRDVIIFEYQGVDHYVLRNNERYTVTWFAGNIKSSIAIDCQEDVLYRILRSIYVMEDQ